MSHEPVAGDELVAVVTYLAMCKAAPSQIPASSLSLRRLEQPELDGYRQLFRRIGQTWLWFSRLLLSDEQLARIIHDQAVEVYVVTDEIGATIGMVELDFRDPGQCELAFIGLVPELAGLGYGRWLLAQTLALAWREGVTRVHVHTCTLDHPAALAAYRNAGFTAYKRGLERFTDPRLLGILPRDCAPQVPLLGTDTSSDSRPASSA